MKKRIVVATMVALMGVGGYHGNRSMTRSNAGESDLLLANIEALARDEISMPCITGIRYTGDFSIVKYCATCSLYYGYSPEGTYALC
ncbi:MAG: hypothetical protein HDR92_01300 [Bacteroides sp.]|nr:hypothetical protein [Bacteroides sp.]